MATVPSPAAGPGKAAKGGPYRKPRADLYTMLLLISLAAIIIAIVCLYLETAEYGSPPWKDVPSVRLQGGNPGGLAGRARLGCGAAGGLRSALRLSSDGFPSFG